MPYDAVNGQNVWVYVPGVFVYDPELPPLSKNVAEHVVVDTGTAAFVVMLMA